MKATSPQDTWETYACSWCEADPLQQRKLFDQSLHPDCVYTDPNGQATGYDQLSGYMAQLQKQVPGAKFVTTAFHRHHDRSLARWNMVDGQGKVLAPGASYGEYAAAGRLRATTGFFDTPEAV